MKDSEKEVNIRNMFYFSSVIRKNEIKGEELKESLKNV